MNEHIPEICATFDIWQGNDCIKGGTTLEIIMRYLADDPEIDHIVSDDERARAYRDYIERQNENLNTKTMIIRDLNKNRTDVLSVSRATIDNLESELKTAKSDYEIMRTNHRNTVAKLQDDIIVKDRAHTLDTETIQELWGVIHDFREGYGASRLFVDAVLIRNLKGDIESLEAELSAHKERIHKSQVINDNRVMVIERLKEEIDSLDAALSTRKEDSAVLMKVVEAVRQYDGSHEHGTMNTFNHVFDLLVDYLDAPEGPPEIPIDDLYKVTVTCAFLEMP